MSDSDNYVCRFDECDSTHDTKRGRSLHETHGHEGQPDEYWRNREFLEREYVRNGNSMQEIADMVNQSYNQVRQEIKSRGIETRGANGTRYFETRERLEQNKDEIIQRYTDEWEPMYAIAKDFDVNDATLRRHLENWGIETRGQASQLEYNVAKEVDILQDERRMRRLYVDEKKSIRQISSEIGVTAKVVSKWLKKHGIEIRDRSDSVKYARRSEPTLSTGMSGYEFIIHAGYAVRHHRLLGTLLVDDIEELRGKHVHHQTKLEWDNRLNRLSVEDPGEHLAHHNELNEFELGESADG